MDKDETYLTVDQVGCARCQGDGHEGLLFQKLTHPLVINDTEMTHWAPCPTNGEPILLSTNADVPRLTIDSEKAFEDIFRAAESALPCEAGALLRIIRHHQETMCRGQR